ncbi:Hypothetical predicted protein, partial [Marmota monax]
MGTVRRWYANEKPLKSVYPVNVGRHEQAWAKHALEHLASQRREQSFVNPFPPMDPYRNIPYVPRRNLHWYFLFISWEAACVFAIELSVVLGK